ncbi:hypothetical protein MOTE_10030 [Moorella thermoacetica]|uniref:SAF domain-containing protein n=1 Tax=Neomoorella thermoacetica TaxID=1525 RepID=A0A1J5P2K5_NEOTH|nr:hypothetical protein MOTE_10030 [Moorella thermoacetica]
MLSWPKKSGTTNSTRVRFRIAVLLSLLAGFSVYFFLGFLYRPVPVVVAAHDIQPNVQIKANDVKVVTVSRNDRHPQAFADPAQVTGRTTAETIHAGTQVIAPQLAGAAAAALQPGETLIPVKNPVITPDLQAGSVVVMVAVNPEGPLVLGHARVVLVSKGLTNDTQVTLALPEGDAPRVAAAAVNAKAFYLLTTQGR